MPGEQDRTVRLSGIWRSCWPCRRRRRRDVVDGETGRITKASARSTRSLQWYRAGLAKQLMDIDEIYGSVTSAQAELHGLNASILAAASGLALLPTPDDERLRVVLDERNKVQTRYQNSWQALLQAGAKLKSPIEDFARGPEHDLLSKRSRSTLQMFVSSCQTSTRRRWRPSKKTINHFKIAEHVHGFCQSHVQRVIRSLELLPLGDSPLHNPNAKVERKYGITTSELYKQTQEKLVTYYPLSPAPKPPNDPDLEQEWENAQRKLITSLERYRWYLEDDHQYDTLLSQLSTGDAKSSAEFTSQWLRTRYKDYEAFQESLEDYLEVRERAMAAGMETVEEPTYLGIEPISHHLEDGTVDDATEEARIDNLNSVDAEEIDEWISAIPSDAVSDVTASDQSAEWTARSVGVGASIVGNAIGLASLAHQALIGKHRVACDALREEAEQEYKKRKEAQR